MPSQFTAETFGFLADLEANNSKDWFEANRDRYEAHWKAPALAFIEDLGPEMARLDPALKSSARINGSLRRINRDVRFSKDKSPYNASLHLVFWTGEHPNRSPGMHFVLSPEGVGYGSGMWGLQPAQLRTWRDMVVDRVEGPNIEKALGAAERVGCTLGKPELQRLPRGFEAEERVGELLRHKSVVARTRGDPASPDVITGEGAHDWVFAMTRAHLHLLRLLTLL